MSYPLAVVLLVGSCVLGACGVENASVDLVELDFEMMQTDIQPLWDRSCAQTSCHGDADRPYRLYSRDGLRAPGHLGEREISEGELELNLEMTRGFLTDAKLPEESFVMRKPLRDAAGGVSHVGGDQFYDCVDPDYLLLLCWLTGLSGAVCL